MKNKLGLLVLIVFIALASMGMSYADDKFIQVFGPVTSWDNEGVDDVGVVIAYPYQDDVVVTISNAYPGYEAYVTFNIIYLSDGTDPIYVDGIVINNIYAGTEMDVVVTDWNGDPIPIDTVLNPGDTLDVKLTVTLLDGAVQDTTYSFSVDLNFSDRLPLTSSSLSLQNFRW